MLIHGQLHRFDGLAIEYINGDKELWVVGKLNHLEGHIVEYDNGEKNHR